MEEHIAVKQHPIFGYWFITWWNPNQNMYTDDNMLSEVIGWDKARYQAKMILEYNAINQGKDVYFKDIADADKAADWVESMLLAAKMRS